MTLRPFDISCDSKNHVRLDGKGDKRDQPKRWMVDLRGCIGVCGGERKKEKREIQTRLLATCRLDKDSTAKRGQ